MVKRKIVYTTIYINPVQMLLRIIGAGADLDFISQLRSPILKIFNIPVLLSYDSLPENAYDSSRKQYLANHLIQHFNEKYDDFRILVVVSVDIYVPGLEFIYALSSYKTAVVSKSRLIPHELSGIEKFNSLVSRVLKVSIHELGHTFNLEHCQKEKCVMSSFTTASELDKLDPKFCTWCENKLRKHIRELRLKFMESIGKWDLL